MTKFVKIQSFDSTGKKAWKQIAHYITNSMQLMCLSPFGQEDFLENAVDWTGLKRFTAEETGFHWLLVNIENTPILQNANSNISDATKKFMKPVSLCPILLLNKNNNTTHKWRSNHSFEWQAPFS